MKKMICRICVTAAALILLLVSGCKGAEGSLFATPSPAPTPTSAPTPTPAPTPVPVIALWGAEGEQSLQDAIRQRVESAGYVFYDLPAGETSLAGFVSEAPSCVIVCCAEEPAPLPAHAGSAYYFMQNGGAVPDGFCGLRYDGTNALQDVFQKIVAYPPHCAPVRLLGLFENEESAAYAAWNEACDNGMFLSRGVCFSAEKDISVWLADQFEDLYPGMLDGIFAETGALGCTASDLMQSLSRDDAEIFCASTSGETLKRMQSEPGRIVCAGGYQPGDAADILTRNAILLLTGKTADNSTLLPEIFVSEGVNAP